MQSKSNQECCNGDCEQGKRCPIRMNRPPFTWAEVKRIWLNFVYGPPLNFTLIEWFVIIATVVSITLYAIR